MDRFPLRVHIPVFSECDPSIIFGVFDTLWGAGRLWPLLHGRPAGECPFTPRLIGTASGPLPLVTGVTIDVQDAVCDIDRTDIVFVPNVLVETADAIAGLDAALIGWIGRMYEAGAHIYAACGGSLVLAQAGLLDGCETTTHWGYVALMQAAFPRVRLRADRILVQAGPGHRITCSGGASSWQDLVLMIIARHAGSQEAIRVSKIFLYQWHRDGQLPYASLLRNGDHRDAEIAALQCWLADNYRRRGAVCGLAQRAGLPQRTLGRRFKRATGLTPLGYVQALRIEEAKHHLETSRACVEEIAARVGYEDAPYFRILFQRLTGMAPGAYRRKFQLPSLALDAGSGAQGGTGAGGPRGGPAGRPQAASRRL